MPRPVKALTTAGLAAGAALLTRRLTQTWGTAPLEADDPLPGDELVPAATVVATRATAIAAPPRAVWPWLVQLGYGRGGFYSHDALERMIGLDIRSAEQIEERWQDLAVGDAVHLAPQVALRVAELETDRHLVLLGDADAVPGGQGAPYDFSWAFVVRPAGTGSRLLVRERYRPHSAAGRALVEVVQPVSFLMTAEMLRGVRARAEKPVGG